MVVNNRYSAGPNPGTRAGMVVANHVLRRVPLPIGVNGAARLVGCSVGRRPVGDEESVLCCRARGRVDSGAVQLEGVC